MHEVMEYFRTGSGSSRSSDKDPTLTVQEFQVSFAGRQTTVVTYFRKVNGKAGLESVEVVKDAKRTPVPLEKQ